MPVRKLTRRLATAAALVGAVGVTAALAQPPATQPPAPTPTAVAEDYGRPVAYVNGNQPITRRDLGEFLMARGGADKIDLLINKIIIENEAKRLNITVTETEMEAAFLTDLEGLSDGGIKKGDFVTIVLPKYNKTLYEWMEDVIRPRLLLTKMITGKIQVTEEDITIQYDREYGEKREVQIIMWPKGDDPKTLTAIWEKIRGDQKEFDSVARQMANPSLAASAGRIKPISRHTYAEDHIIEKTAFDLKVGEVSHILQTKQGHVVMKLLGVIPPVEKIDRAMVRPRHTKQAYDEKVSAAIPAQFKVLHDAAAPSVIYNGPSLWKWHGETKEAVNEMIKSNTVTPAGGTAPKVMPSAPAPGVK